MRVEVNGRERKRKTSLRSHCRVLHLPRLDVPPIGYLAFNPNTDVGTVSSSTSKKRGQSRGPARKQTRAEKPVACGHLPWYAHRRSTRGGKILSGRTLYEKLRDLVRRAFRNGGDRFWRESKQPPKKLKVDLGKGVKLEMVLIPAGEFMMGSGESAEATAAFFKKNYGMDFLTADAFKYEHPQHRVRITKPFYLGTYHVTRGQFRQFVADAGYKTDAEVGIGIKGAFGWDPDKKEFRINEKYSWRNAGFEQTDEHPAVNVSWTDAVAFCKWLSKKESKTYRLPTEAEWEYACRAGTTTRYYSGDDPETLAKVGNVADAAAKAQFPAWKYTMKASDGYVFTAPVGKFKPNAFGLYDMHGNAWQWCMDWIRRGILHHVPRRRPNRPRFR